MLFDNRRMLDVFHDSGLTETVRLEQGVFHVVLSLAITDRFVEHRAVRSQAAASMRAFFEPRVVAVVGANCRRGKIGSEILSNLIASGFTGSVVPVHPTANELARQKAYPRVTNIPGAVDHVRRFAATSR
jgi:hypothetical protein